MFRSVLHDSYRDAFLRFDALVVFRVSCFVFRVLCFVLCFAFQLKHINCVLLPHLGGWGASINCVWNPFRGQGVEFRVPQRTPR